MTHHLSNTAGAESLTSLPFRIIYLMVLSQYRDHTTFDGRMEDELFTGRDLVGSVCSLVEIIFRHLNGETWKYTKTLG